MQAEQWVSLQQAYPVLNGSCSTPYLCWLACAGYCSCRRRPLRLQLGIEHLGDHTVDIDNIGPRYACKCEGLNEGIRLGDSVKSEIKEYKIATTRGFIIASKC
jgi:hypothetical protein